MILDNLGGHDLISWKILRADTRFRRRNSPCELLLLALLAFISSALEILDLPGQTPQSHSQYLALNFLIYISYWFSGWIKLCAGPYSQRAVTHLKKSVSSRTPLHSRVPEGGSHSHCTWEHSPRGDIFHGLPWEWKQLQWCKCMVFLHPPWSLVYVIACKKIKWTYFSPGRGNIFIFNWSHSLWC